MESIHPQVTHFPIALIITAFLLQIIVVVKPGWIGRSTPLWLLALGAIFSIVSALSGQDAANTALRVSDLPESTRLLIARHQRSANITLWGSLGALILLVWLSLRFPGNRRLDILTLGLLLVLSISVAVTGLLGGELVLSHGVGVAR